MALAAENNPLDFLVDEEESVNGGGGGGGGEEEDGGIEIGEDESDADVEEDDDDDSEAVVLPTLMGVDDPMRMVLTEEEEEWAMAIKVAIEGDPELDNISDYMIVHLALICRENVEDAVSRAASLQAFREEYGITGSYAEGCRALSDYLSIFPESLLHFGFSVSEGTYVFAMDVVKFDSTVINSERRLHQYFVACYYIAHTFYPDVESIRKGVISMAECEGLDWTRKQDFNVLQKLFSELWSCYPLKGCFNHYHTGVLFNLFMSLMKKALPKDIRNDFRVGMTCDGRLDAICMVPNVKAATERLLCQMKNTLKLRFENERHFSLDPARN